MHERKRVYRPSELASDMLVTFEITSVAIEILLLTTIKVNNRFALARCDSFGACAFGAFVALTNNIELMNSYAINCQERCE